MGGSGSGKTTILRVLGGQARPQAGTVTVDGQNVHALRHRELFALRRRMGMLFQFGALFTDMSVFDNVAFPLREHTDLPESAIRDLVLMKLNAVGLRGAQALMPAEVSGGMARRVALARAIALDPQLIMYDEPFAGLDPISLGQIAGPGSVPWARRLTRPPSSSPTTSRNRWRSSTMCIFLPRAKSSPRARRIRFAPPNFPTSGNSFPAPPTARCVSTTRHPNTRPTWG